MTHSGSQTINEETDIVKETQALGGAELGYEGYKHRSDSGIGAVKDSCHTIGFGLELVLGLAHTVDLWLFQCRLPV